MSLLLACNIMLPRRDFASVCLSLGGNLQLHCIIIHWNWHLWKVPAKCCRADCVEERQRDTTRYDLALSYSTKMRSRYDSNRDKSPGAAVDTACPAIACR